MKIFQLPPLVVAALIALSGCSSRAWYESAKMRAENECRRQPSGEADGCLARVNRMSYDDYERMRSGERP